MPTDKENNDGAFSARERELFVRGIMASSRREDREFRVFIATIPDEVNGELKEISLHYEPNLDADYTRFIAQAWDKSGHLPIDEIQDQMACDWIEFIVGDATEHRRAVSEKVSLLLHTYDLKPSEKHVAQITLDILMDIWLRLDERLFPEYMRSQKIPEATILRFFPPPPTDTLIRVMQALDAGFLYPDNTERAPSRDDAKIIPFIKPDGREP